MQTATHTDSDAYRQLEKVRVCLTGSGLYRQPVSSVLAVFQQWAPTHSIYSAHCQQTRRRRAPAAVGVGPDALAVGADRSASVMLGPGVSRGIDSADLAILTTARQLAYARAKAGGAPGAFLFKGLDLLSVSRPGIHRQRRVSISVAVAGCELCHPHSL